MEYSMEVSQKTKSKKKKKKTKKLKAEFHMIQYSQSQAYIWTKL